MLGQFFFFCSEKKICSFLFLIPFFCQILKECSKSFNSTVSLQMLDSDLIKQRNALLVELLTRLFLIADESRKKTTNSNGCFTPAVYCRNVQKPSKSFKNLNARHKLNYKGDDSSSKYDNLKKI